MSVLIRMDNLGGGGGWQVAQSFLSELAVIIDEPEILQRFPWLKSELRILVNTGVAEQVGSDVLSSLPVAVGGSPGLGGNALRRHSADVIFTLFGPTYDRTEARRRIAGFADVTSLYWDSDAVGPASAAGRLRRAVRRRLSERFYRRCDRVIVEAPHIARDLSHRWNVDADKIVIVPNVLNGVFGDSNATHPAPRNDVARFCYVTRAYPHKNLRLLGEVGPLLRSQYGIEVRFVLTLTPTEWAAQPPAVREWSTNLGPVPISSVPQIYRESDGCVFPSKLEAFSTTPLEALATRTPLIASDLPFCRDLLEGAALLASPEAAKDWARAIAEVLEGGPSTAKRVTRGYELVASWPTARERALRYLEVIHMQVASV